MSTCMCVVRMYVFVCVHACIASFSPNRKQNILLEFLTTVCLSYREEASKEPEEDEDEDLVSKAEEEFFKIVEAERKAREEADRKHGAVAEVKQGLAQEGTTHEDYQSAEGGGTEVRRGNGKLSGYWCCDLVWGIRV